MTLQYDSEADILYILPRTVDLKFLISPMQYL